MKVRVIKVNEKIAKEECVNLLPFGSVGVINYKNQINGKGKELVELGRFSEQIGGLTLVGAISDNCGIKKKSVFVFRGGRLISICDMARQEEKFTPSNGYKLVDFNNKKIGVLVDRDLFSPSAVASLVNCGSGAIICLADGLALKKSVVASEFYSYVFGVDFVCASFNESYAFNAFGEKKEFVFGQVDLNFEGVFKEIRVKKRGF